ncbi:hypothetical protein QTO34_006992 [Cnephaeus nilssonii]|uniref:Rad60/SUMO-like domain-containing protein n=1 Tax=Cnephaeus nilssonii TaxID=3371016 RepID=A0AA40HJE6_CNENI|nr:hypothetical protein QTO34_006992 [Eptesicus nilssonii]
MGKNILRPGTSFVKRQLRRLRRSPWPTKSPRKESRLRTENNDHINSKVAGQDGSVVQFKIKRHTPLSDLMKAYCERQLEMEDEDTVDVFQQQTGVSYFALTV